MKILQFTFSLTSGGGEKFAVDLANEFSITDDVYFCVVLSEKIKVHSFFKEQLNKNVKYINLNCSKGMNIKTFFSVFKLIYQIRPDVIHFHLNTIVYYYLPSLLFKNKIKFIHTLHNIASKTIGFKWQKKINSFFYKRKLINAIAISDENKKTFETFFGHDNVILINNGTTSPNKSFNFDKVTNEIDKLKSKSSDKVFIHIATFLESKNQKLLVNVFNRLLGEGKGVILIIIGKYFDSEEAKNLREMSAEGIFYLGTKTNITDYLMSSDAFILSSLWEGLPISLLEAMSCGVIPISTPAGGIPDVIINESLGYISKDFSEQGLYNAVIKCLKNIETFDRSILIKYYKNNFSMEQCAMQYMDVYKT